MLKCWPTSFSRSWQGSSRAKVAHLDARNFLARARSVIACSKPAALCMELPMWPLASRTHRSGYSKAQGVKPDKAIALKANRSPDELAFVVPRAPAYDPIVRVSFEPC